ncbi:MAG: PAS domain-containing protein [Deltaproteobacteria bacterium]|nr:PAS domain-containing protein [Deltaproteobacteria bacterium]
MRERLASLLLSSMRCGVIAVDAEGTVMLWNRPAAEILGIGPEGTEGRHCREVLAPYPALAHLLLEALGRTTLPDRAELELERPDGGRELVGFSLSRVEAPDGAVLGSALFFKDLTVVEEEREREALRSRLASLGEVAAQLAHEIRNRLGGIRLFLGLARRRLDHDPEGTEFLGRAEQELLEANRKMGEILAFVRPLRLETGPVDAEALCREAWQGVVARFGGETPRLSWEAEPGLPPARADREKLRDALSNVLANAVEAAGPGGTVRVRISLEEVPTLVAEPGATALPGLRQFEQHPASRLRIEVEDDGPGMEPEVLRRVFHPFFTTKEGGSGLGVPTAQKILDAHGGGLDVTSEPGRGARFVLRVPVVTEETDRG